MFFHHCDPFLCTALILVPALAIIIVVAVYKSALGYLFIFFLSVNLNCLLPLWSLSFHQDHAHIKEESWQLLLKQGQGFRN